MNLPSCAIVSGTRSKRPLLLLATFVLTALMPQVAGAGDGLDKLIINWRTAHNTSSKTGALHSLVDYECAEDSKDAQRITRCLTRSLRDDDNEVRCCAAKLLGKAPHRTLGKKALVKALGKHENKLKGVYKSYIENYAKLLKLLKRDTTKGIYDDVDRMIKLINQFLAGSRELFERLERDRLFVTALIDSMVEYPDDATTKQLKTYYRKTHDYSFKDGIPPALAILKLEGRAALDAVIDGYQYYDHKDMQADIKEYEKDEYKEARDPIIDWGKKYHEGLTALAAKHKLSDDAPKKFGPRIEVKWKAWWEKHRESFPFSIEKDETEQSEAKPKKK